MLNARIELYACLQLLADRARFITGATWAAIAMREGDEMIYCAAAGSSAPVIGSPLDAKTLQSGQPVSPDNKSLLVAVVRESKTTGFFQLVSNSAEFNDDDLQSIIRLAGMVGTAVDCVEAEEHSTTEQSTPVIPMAVAPIAIAQSPTPAAPVLWHAPEGSPSGPSSKSSAASEFAVSIYACESCGFPVSKGRTICLDCEERGTSSAANMVRLLSTRQTEEESWLSAHGYTIASLLISALVAAIIYWLHYVTPPR
jgi:hypothetical protein